MSRKIICGIYKIMSPSKRVYIGQSTNIEKRKNYYKNGGCDRQRRLFNSIKKYGWSNHVFTILHICTPDELNSLEIYYGDLYNCYDDKVGLNLTKCGKSSGFLSEETKRLISEKAKGKNNVMYGRPVSEETRRKRSIALTGQKRSAEFCKKLSERQIGEKNHFYRKTFSEEHRKKLSTAAIGRKPSEETIKKLRRRKPEQSKIILNQQTGIFYIGVQEAAASIGKKAKYLFRKLCGERNNCTSFIYS